MPAILSCVTVAALLVGACQGAPGDDAAKVAETKTADAGIDADTAKKLAQAREALATVADEDRNLAAGKGLAYAEEERLSKKVVDALGNVPRAPADQRLMLATNPISDVAPRLALERLCAGKAADVLPEVAKAPPAEQVALVWDGCALERAGLVSRAEADTSDVGTLVLAHLVLEMVRAKGGLVDDERELLRVLVIDSAAR